MGRPGPAPDRHALAWEAGAEWALTILMDQGKTREEVRDHIIATLAEGRRLRDEASQRNR